MLALAAATAAQDKPAEKPSDARVLKVKLNYNGAGKVDASHRIFVFLFDSPVFSENAVPVAMMTAESKDAAVVFSAVPTSPVYALAAFDPKGSYDGQSGPPPSGSSIGIYVKNASTPEPINIEPGRTVEIELTFDDSNQIP